MSRLLTIPETAQLLRVSNKTVERLIKGNGLPVLQPGGYRGFRRVDEAQLWEWVGSNRAQAPE